MRSARPGAASRLAVVSPDGKLVTERWIAGGKGGVTLNAPKGMAIDQGTLYVSDTDVLRTFDLKTGAFKGHHEIKGASFLNDVAADTVGHRIYVSDSGTGADGVWVVEGKTVKSFYANKDLGRPNGLWVMGKDLYVNFFGSADFASDTKRNRLVVPRFNHNAVEICDAR